MFVGDTFLSFFVFFLDKMGKKYYTMICVKAKMKKSNGIYRLQRVRSGASRAE